MSRLQTGDYARASDVGIQVGLDPQTTWRILDDSPASVRVVKMGWLHRKYFEGVEKPPETTLCPELAIVRHVATGEARGAIEILTAEDRARLIGQEQFEAYREKMDGPTDFHRALATIEHWEDRALTAEKALNGNGGDHG